MIPAFDKELKDTFHRLITDPHLKQFVDGNLTIPKAFHGNDAIKLVVLGHDPTVKNTRLQSKITTVLNLDRDGNLRRYLSQVCVLLGLDLDRNIYATYYFKNIFTMPPNQFKREEDVYAKFSQVWLPLLHKELAFFDNVPILTLGEAVLSLIVKDGTSSRVSEYWGYDRVWISDKIPPFRYIHPSRNILNRVVFPFPHGPNLRRFYSAQLEKYMAFMRRIITS